MWWTHFATKLGPMTLQTIDSWQCTKVRLMYHVFPLGCHMLKRPDPACSSFSSPQLCSTPPPRAVRQYSWATSAIWVRMYPPHCTRTQLAPATHMLGENLTQERNTTIHSSTSRQKERKKDRLISFTVTELGKYEWGLTAFWSISGIAISNGEEL